MKIKNKSKCNHHVQSQTPHNPQWTVLTAQLQEKRHTNIHDIKTECKNGKINIDLIWSWCIDCAGVKVPVFWYIQSFSNQLFLNSFGINKLSNII